MSARGRSAAAPLLLLLVLAPLALSVGVHAQEGSDPDGTLLSLAARAGEEAAAALRATLAEAGGAQAELAQLNTDATWLAAAAARETRSATDRDLRGTIAREVGALHDHAVVMDGSWATWAAQRSRLEEPDAVQRASEALTTAQLTIGGARASAEALDELGVPHDELDDALDEYAAAVDEAWRILGQLSTAKAEPVLRIYLDPPAPQLYDVVRVQGLASNFREPPAVEVLVDGIVVTTTRARGGGSFSAILPEAALTIGEHVAQVRASAANTTVSSPPLKFSVSKLPIALHLTLLTPDTPAGENASILLAAVTPRGGISREAVVSLADRTFAVTTRDGLAEVLITRPEEGGSVTITATMEGNQTLASGRSALVLLGPPPARNLAVASDTLIAAASLFLTIVHGVAVYALRPRFPLVRFLPFVASPLAALPLLIGVSARSAAVALFVNLLLGGILALLRRPTVSKATEPSARAPEGVPGPAPLPPAGVDEHEIVRRYHELLAVLHEQGVDVRALTPREVAGEMSSRGASRADVDTLTRIIEAHLYREDRSGEASLRLFEEAASRVRGAT